MTLQYVLKACLKYKDSPIKSVQLGFKVALPCAASSNDLPAAASPFFVWLHMLSAYQYWAQIKVITLTF